MKRVINISLIVFLIIYLVCLVLPSVNKLVFIVKHLSFYLFIGLLAFRIIVFFANLLINKAEGKASLLNIINLLKVFTFILVLSVVGLLQYEYIEQKERIYILGCLYYDEYDNLIYESLYWGNCPELEDYINEDEHLSFTVKETKTGFYAYYNFLKEDGGRELLNSVNLTFDTITKVNISYDAKRIVNVEMHRNEVIKVEKDSIKYALNSYYRNVTIDYENLEITSADGEYHHHDTNETSHNFTSDELTLRKLYALKQEVDDKNQRLDIYKEVDGESELLSTSYVSIYDRVIETDIYQEVANLTSKYRLKLNEDYIEHELLTYVDDKLIDRNYRLFASYRDIDYLLKRKEAKFSDKVIVNYKYRHSFDVMRNSIILQDQEIYECKATSFGKVIKEYIQPKQALFGEKYLDYVNKYIELYHYYDIVTKGKTLFDYEYDLMNNGPGNDVIYQRFPFYEEYYK